MVQASYGHGCPYVYDAMAYAMRILSYGYGYPMMYLYYGYGHPDEYDVMVVMPWLCL